MDQKPIEKYSNEEITDILRRAENADVSGSLYHQARNEAQERQKEENYKQINSLIEEVRELKEITDKNAKLSSLSSGSSKRLAVLAIIITLIGVVLQVIFSIKQDTTCGPGKGSVDRPGFTIWDGCYRLFDLGIFGKHTVYIGKMLLPSGKMP